MISKELLSEIMRKQIGGDEECKEIKIINNVLYFTAFHKHKINIYELSHKCKEWALKKGYILSSHMLPTNKICSIKRISEAPPFIDEVGILNADTEPEAIFKACEWIVSTDTKSMM